MELKQDISQPLSGHRFEEDGEIHIWHIDLDHGPGLAQPLFKTLSSDEQQKANNFRFSKDRSSYVAARGALRKILGSYLNVLPNQIRFSYNRYGKPFLNVEDNLLRFNVSHSSGIALVAVARGQEVGVDLEFMDRNFNILQTASTVFSPTQCSELERLPARLRTFAFFRAWTRMEAYLKAVGMGFASEQTRAAISELIGQSTIIYRANGFQKSRKCSLVSLATENNYVSALATDGAIGTIRTYRLFDN
ncbi:MAG: 4'-phosphopantetheinyl transferase superfamily protein [Pyrinomonadaceae bacterium]